MRLSLPLVGAVLLLGACTQASAQGPVLQGPAAAPVPSPAPAAAAGGPCELLDFGTLGEALGIEFDVAASTTSGKTATCVVQTSADSLPDLTLTVSPTTADAAVFRDEMGPDGATAVKGLGKSAYRGTAKAGKERGPVAEVGWLTADKHMLVLRLTLPPGTARKAAEQHTGGLVTLAKQVDAARG